MILLFIGRARKKIPIDQLSILTTTTLLFGICQVRLKDHPFYENYLVKGGVMPYAVSRYIMELFS